MISLKIDSCRLSFSSAENKTRLFSITHTIVPQIINSLIWCTFTHKYLMSHILMKLILKLLGIFIGHKSLEPSLTGEGNVFELKIGCGKPATPPLPSASILAYIYVRNAHVVFVQKVQPNQLLLSF